MNIDEFNKKWENHLEDGFSGLQFDDENYKISTWLDKHFEVFRYINPDFTFSQVKLKFGMVCTYLDGLPSICSEIVEEELNKLWKNR